MTQQTNHERGKESIVEIAENFYLRWDSAILTHPYLDKPENMKLKNRAEQIRIDMKELSHDLKQSV